MNDGPGERSRAAILGIIQAERGLHKSELVRRCGKAFGLELYGVDLVKTANGYSVIEVNCFPGYKGVPDGGRRIADFVVDRFEGRTGSAGEPGA